MRQTLKKTEILRGKSNFQELYRSGKRIEGKVLRCLFLTRRHSADESRVSSVVIGLAVSRKVKRAVDRNRVKRLIRESFRLNKQLLDPAKLASQTSILLLFIYSPKMFTPEKIPSFADIRDDVKEILSSPRIPRVTETK